MLSSVLGDDVERDLVSSLSSVIGIIRLTGPGFRLGTVLWGFQVNVQILDFWGLGIEFEIILREY